MKICKKTIWLSYLWLDGSLKKYNYCKDLDVAGYEIAQKENLDKLIEHCRRHVPYYRNKFDTDGFNYAGFTSLPVMSKDDIRKNFNALTSDDVNKRGCYKNSSGGSTGEPLVFLQDKTHSEWARAVKSLYDSWSGLEPCDKQLRLWGSERDVFGQGATTKQKIVRWLKNETWINTFDLNDDLINSILLEINSGSYKQITSYVDTAAELVRYMGVEKQIKYDGSILTSAGTLYAETARQIEQAFGCPVYNRYGSREVGDIACTYVPGDSRLLVFAPVHFVEVLDLDLNPVAVGEVGDVVVTTLQNYSMPLIRYKIGDIAKVAKYNKNGSVESFESVEGRSTDLLMSDKGGTVLPAYFIHMFGVVEKNFPIKKIQFIQLESLRLEILVVFIDGCPVDLELFRTTAARIVCQVLGAVDFEIIKVDDIPKNPNGKFRYVISHVKR